MEPSYRCSFLRWQWRQLLKDMEKLSVTPHVPCALRSLLSFPFPPKILLMRASPGYKILRGVRGRGAAAFSVEWGNSATSFPSGKFKGRGKMTLSTYRPGIGLAMYIISSTTTLPDVRTL